MAKLATIRMRMHPEFLERLTAAHAAVEALNDVIRSDRVVQFITDPSEGD